MSAGGRWTQSRLRSAVLAAALAGCSGERVDAPLGAGAGTTPCDGFCQDGTIQLTVADVETVIAQSHAEAQLRGRPAVIAVTDRVGNVLALWRMEGAPATVRVGTPPAGARVDGGLEGVSLVPAEAAAIAKAITGAYLSSEGNAFSTRTASQIVQANFNPGETDQPGGPLFGVQFSQLPCSDLATRFVAGSGPGPGPQRSPLGLAADPGGFPLYKNGTVVGGIGVEADGQYAVTPPPTRRSPWPAASASRRRRTGARSASRSTARCCASPTSISANSHCSPAAARICPRW
jgi:uncharacterized protein GlcG (DUF336 family)